MSLDQLVARAETRKIARLLGVAVDEVAYLEACAPEDLATLRMQMTDDLFEGEGAALRRAADASKLLPIPLLSTIAQKAMGPMLCGRLSGLLAPDRAAAVAERLPVEFLAEVAGETDPRRAVAVISRIPASQASGVARVLGREREYVAMGRFVAYLGDAALTACINELDDEALVETAYTMEGKDRLDRVIRLASDERLATVPATVERLGLWPEIVDLIAHLGPEQRERLIRLGGAGGVGYESRVREHAKALGVSI